MATTKTRTRKRKSSNTANTKIHIKTNVKVLAIFIGILTILGLIWLAN